MNLINTTNKIGFSSSTKKNSIKDILNKSSRAVCGTFEREVIVPTNKVSSTKSRLKSKGFIIVGTGRAGANSTKIWFNPAGANI